MEKYGRDEQATDGNIIRLMPFACWMPEATDTPSMYHLLLLYANNSYAYTPQCYVDTHIAYLVFTVLKACK